MDSMTTPTPTNIIAEVCTIVLSSYKVRTVKVQDEWTLSPLVLVNVEVRAWQWPWFDADDVEDRILRLLKIIAPSRHFRVCVTAE